jgi:hypothetical protein
VDREHPGTRFSQRGFDWKKVSLGIYLIVKGFKPSPILAMDGAVTIPESASASREEV